MEKNNTKDSTTHQLHTLFFKSSNEKSEKKKQQLAAKLARMEALAILESRPLDDPQAEKIREEKYGLLTDLAEAYFDQGEYQKAKDCYTKSLECLPEAGSSPVIRSVADMAILQLDQLIDDQKRATVKKT